MNRGPFDDLRETLHDISQTTELNLGPTLDHGRRHRSGVPEVVFAATKTPEEVASSLRSMARQGARAIASRCAPEHFAAIADLRLESFEVELDPVGKTAVVFHSGVERPVSGGVVGVITAGSSDAPVASEAALVAREMGAEVLLAGDVGVAGLHRLVYPLESFVASDVDVLIVCAGMDGVLPSVVSGLVSIPVIGVPVSTGYGLGGQGVGALTTMLQSCAPGVVVVNIDNGVGAGATAALIANRVGEARSGR